MTEPEMTHEELEEARDSVRRELMLAAVIGLLAASKAACKDVFLGLADDPHAALSLAQGHLALALGQLTPLVVEGAADDETDDEADDYKGADGDA